MPERVGRFSGRAVCVEQVKRHPGLSLDSLAPGIYSVTLTGAAEAVYPVGVTVGTDETEGEAAFTLFPNPTRDWVWLVFGRTAGQERLLRVWGCCGRGDVGG